MKVQRKKNTSWFGFQMVGTIDIPFKIIKIRPFEIRSSKIPDFKCFKILNGRISDPNYLISCFYLCQLVCNYLRVHPHVFLPGLGTKIYKSPRALKIPQNTHFQNPGGKCPLPFLWTPMVTLMLLWAHFDSWCHNRRCIHLAGKLSSRVHICSTENRHLVTTCTWANFSSINFLVFSI